VFKKDVTACNLVESTSRSSDRSYRPIFYRQ